LGSDNRTQDNGNRTAPPDDTPRLDEWYRESFGEDYLIVYRHRTLSAAEREVRRMIGWLGLPAGARVLDVGCGTGRHALALGKLGYRVTGLDLSETLLTHARRLAPEMGIDWHLGDMREMPFPANRFDAVVNWFTTFGYFATDAENARVLGEIARVLKPGGRFLIDYLNPAHVRRHLVPLSERLDEPTGCRIREERAIRDGRVIKRITVTPPAGQPRRYVESVRLYGLDVFRRMAREAGLSIQQVRGDYDGAAYDAETSERLILIGGKR
jgi:ubiquinone/menaquinone biosynthesis C-methylase UbiE